MVVGYRFLVFGCGLLIGCYYITNNQIPTTYYPKLFLYFSLLIFYTSPRQWGLRGILLLAKVELLHHLLLAIRKDDALGIGRDAIASHIIIYVLCRGLGCQIADGCGDGALEGDGKHHLHA